MRARICDRCHAVSSEPPQELGLEVRKRVTTSYGLVRRYKYFDDDVDLCPDCRRELEKFMLNHPTDPRI